MLERGRLRVVGAPRFQPQCFDHLPLGEGRGAHDRDDPGLRLLRGTQPGEDRLREDRAKVHEPTFLAQPDLLERDTELATVAGLIAATPGGGS